MKLSLIFLRLIYSAQHIGLASKREGFRTEGTFYPKPTSESSSVIHTNIKFYFVATFVLGDSWSC